MESQKIPITVFIGLSKNVGKTTFLNKYIKNKENFLITSIGWDGEAIDHIFGITKPSIKVNKDNLVCTYSNLKPLNSEKIYSIEIENQFLGTLEVYKITEDDIVQIAGPSSIKQMGKFLNLTQKQIQYNQISIREIIIDGAADRRISLYFADNVYFVIGPTYSPNPQKIIKTIQGIIKLLEIPLINPENEEFSQKPIFLNSINSENIKKLDPNQTYIIESLSNIILDYILLPKILENLKIFVRRKPKNYKIVVNSFNAELMTHTLNPNEIINFFNNNPNLIALVQ